MSASAIDRLGSLWHGLRDGVQHQLMLCALLAMALFQFGRGPGNVAWGLLSIASAVTVLANYRILLHHRLQAVLLLVFMVILSLAGANAEPFPAWPIKYWLATLCSALVFFHLQLCPPDFQAARSRAAHIAVLALLALAGHWVYISLTIDPQTVEVAKVITGTVAVVLAPWVFMHGGWSVLQKWLLMMLFMALLMLLDSRTEVLALLVALCVYQLCCWQRLRWILALLPLLLFMVLLPELWSDEGAKNITLASLNQISSSRMDIWRAAIDACSQAPWFGHGLYSSVKADFLPVDIRHIHNIVLELIYEAGVIGFAAVALFMALAFLPMILQCKQWPKAQRRQAAVILAAAAATLTVLFFDKSLHSVFGRFYIFVLAGLAFSLAEQHPKPQTNPLSPH